MNLSQKIKLAQNRATLIGIDKSTKVFLGECEQQQLKEIIANSNIFELTPESLETILDGTGAKRMEYLAVYKIDEDSYCEVLP